MKKEELDKLKSKYWEGKTSLQEERRLKAQHEEDFFALLRSPQQKMDWEFDDFLDQVSAEKKPETKKVMFLTARTLAVATAAACLIIGFFVIDHLGEQKADKIAPVVAQTDSNNQILDAQTRQMRPENTETKNDEPKYTQPARKSSESETALLANNNKDQPALVPDVRPAPVQQEEAYVEINGVKIYDEQKAIEVTQTALQLATSNLKKGLKGVEHIKYLSIEI